jgi:hypothetical protein
MPRLKKKALVNYAPRVLAIVAVTTCLPITAQAADETLTLACKGTATTIVKDAKPEPVSMGIIVSFAARTVTGFEGDYPVSITAFDDLHISFSGSRGDGDYWTIEGSLDRVTGDMEAGWTKWRLTRDLKHEVAFSQVLALKCRPAQRMF